MKDQDKYIIGEIFLTAGLFYSAVFLLPAQFTFYSLLTAAGVFCGFVFSSFVRDRYKKRVNIITGSAAIVVLLWLLFRLFNSTFLYRDVISILLQGILVLSVILSFNAYSYTARTDIQGLSIPLFMSHAIWIQKYDGIIGWLVLAYLILGVVILKIKFRGFFKTLAFEIKHKDYSTYILIFFFLASVLAAWLFATGYGKVNQKGGILRDPTIKGEMLDQKNGQSPEAPSIKEYYDLQDKLQKEITDRALESKVVQASRDAFSAFSVLINEIITPMDVDKSEKQIIHFLQSQNKNIENDNAKILAILESYVDKKVSLNTQNAQENIGGALKKIPFNIKERFSVLTQVNKIQHDNTIASIFESEKQIEATLERSSMSNGLKKEIQGYLSRLRDWKYLELYRKKNKSLRKNIDSLSQDWRDSFSEVSAGVDRAQSVADSKNISGKIRELGKDIPGNLQDIFKEMEQAADLKSEMIIAEEFRRSKEELNSSEIPKFKAEDIKTSMDKIKNSRDSQEFLKEKEKLEALLKDAGIESNQSIKQVLQEKKEYFAKQKKDSISQTLQASNLSDKGEKILNDVEGMESAQTNNELDSAAKNVQEQVDDARKKGFISEQTKESLARDIDELNDLLKMKKAADSQGSQEKSKIEENIRLKMTSISDMLQATKLPDAGKKIMKDIQKMESSKTNKELDQAKKNVQEQVDDARKKGFIPEQAKDSLVKDIDDLNGLLKIKEEMDSPDQQDKNTSEEDIRKKITGISDMLQATKLPDAGKKIMKDVQDLESAKTNEKRKTSAEKAKDQIDAQAEKGLIPGATKDSLKKQIDELNKLLNKGSEPNQQNNQDKAEIKDYQQSLLLDIKKSVLDADEQKAFSQLTEELFKAPTFSQMEDIQEQVNAQIKSLDQASPKKKWAEKFSKDFQEMKNLRQMSQVGKSISKLRDKIERLGEINPAKAEELEEQLEKVEKSKTGESVQKNINKLTQKLQDLPDVGLTPGKKDSLLIELLPRSLVISKGNSSFLRSISVFRGTYIKDITADLEWISQNPLIASVDQKGAVSALSKGHTTVFCRYKGSVSRKTQIQVTEEIPEDVYIRWKNEMVR